jgi:hypothetical protein
MWTKYAFFKPDKGRRKAGGEAGGKRRLDVL